jgi:hypothetical protein
MTEWTISFDGGYVDTVFFMKCCDRDYVLNSLINHDGYNSNIEITKVTK